MGKTFKEKPGKYRDNRDFQKKHKKKNKHRNDSSAPDEQMWKTVDDRFES